MINNKNFEHRPLSELLAIVKRGLRKLDDEGLIDEGTVIKEVMRLNSKFGIPLREVKQACIPVFNGKANLPKDFDKLYYVCALPIQKVEKHNFKNPFDNSFDRDIIYEAEVNREKIGGSDNYQVVIKKITNVDIKTYTKFIELELAPASIVHSIGSSPVSCLKGRKQISIEKDTIICPFEEGELYLMYVGNMKDKDGNLLFPFHPMITPYYEWVIKEAILVDAIMNSDGNYGDLLELASQKRTAAWIDAFNAASDKGFGEYVDMQKKREMNWHNQYFKMFQ